MASALEKILKSTIQKSDSQKAFSPWWEDLEDKLLYSLMIFGMITLPFNMVSNTPVECTIDPNHPSNKNITLLDGPLYRYHHFYLRKYCTLNFISQEMVFLPFILILAPMPLVAIGRLFLSFFKVEKKMNSLYQLLVKESLDREDVDAMEKENIKDCHEIVQMFRNSNGIYHAFICRTIVQLIFGTATGFVLLQVFLYSLSSNDINCDLFDKHYTCVVPLANFYWTIVLLSIISMVIYCFCVIYNFVWMTVPYLSPLFKFMVRTKRHVSKSIRMGTMNSTTYQSLSSSTGEEFFDMYFDPKSKDLPLLITLLGTRHGVAETLRLLSLFDKDYQKLWKPIDCQIDFETENQVVHVSWNDAPIAEFIHTYRGRICKMNVEYTLEIIPNSESPIKSRVFEDDPQLILQALKAGAKFKKPFKYKESFYGVEIPSTETKADGDADKKKCEMKIIISTEVNGRTISQKNMKVPLPSNKSTMSNDLIQTVESTISEDTQSSAKYKSTNFVFNFSSRKNNSNNGSIQNSIQKPLLDSGKQLKSGEPEKKKGSVCLRQDTVV